MKHLCTLLVILVIICSSSVAQVSWFLKTGEARLENNETLELVCQVATGPCCSLQRRWKGGIGFSTLITNGVTSFPQKYGEIVQASSLQFSLLIYNLSVSDINVNYQCEYGFDFSLQQLSMNESIFRYVSKPDEVKILEWNYTKNQFSVAVNITRVFPLPTCIASYKGTQLTPLVKPYDNGLFKYAEVSMIYIGFECPGTLIITCAVGSHQFEVFNASPCPVTTTSLQTTTQLNTAETTNSTNMSSTTSSWLYENKYYFTVSGGVGALLLTIGLCCFYHKRRNQNDLSQNEFEIQDSLPSKSTTHG